MGRLSSAVTRKGGRLPHAITALGKEVKKQSMIWLIVNGCVWSCVNEIDELFWEREKDKSRNFRPPGRKELTASSLQALKNEERESLKVQNKNGALLYLDYFKVVSIL